MSHAMLRALLTVVLIAGFLAVVQLGSARASSPPCRYTLSNTDAGNDTVVIDNVTGLQWQQTTSGSTYAWSAAAAYCQGLSYGGYSSGWRLPTVRELVSIVDYTTTGPSIDQNFFPSTSTSYFWSATLYENDAGSGAAWGVNFYGGNSNDSVVTKAYPVRCVR